MTFFDCTADLVGQMNGNGQKGLLQIDAPPVENFWLRHCLTMTFSHCTSLGQHLIVVNIKLQRFGQSAKLLLVGHPT